MSKRIKLPPAIKPTARLKPGKGWRLIDAKRVGTLKATLVATYASSSDRFVIFKLRS